MVHCTPGLVHLHYSTSSPQTSTRRWRQSPLRLKTHRGSTASSALHPPSGITYLPIHDEFLITLSDGSINVLQGLCTDRPHLADDSRSSLLEGEVAQDQRALVQLSTNARSIFARSEQGEVDKHDLNKITGMTGYDPNDGVFVWSYEYALEFSMEVPSIDKSFLGSIDPEISVISTMLSKRVCLSLQACGIRAVPRTLCCSNWRECLTVSKPVS